MTTEVYSFDVTVSTHDDLMRGVVAIKVLGSQYPWHRCTVAAESPEEAELIAQQMASCHYYVTGSYPRY
jgi:hypothetical protein